MEQSGNALLLRFINSDHFDAFLCITYLQRYANNIGIHHYLCNKLKSYNYDDLEFFIPQLLQLIITIETNSMALEDFILSYCESHPHFSLLTFWNLQAHIFELRNDPESYSFQVVRRLINNIQNIIFTDYNLTLPISSPSSINSNSRNDNSFRENLNPSVILSGTIGSIIAVPQINDYIYPIIKSQGKQQKSFVFKLANFQKTLTRNLTMKNKKLNSITSYNKESLLSRSSSVRTTPSSPAIPSSDPSTLIRSASATNINDDGNRSRSNSRVSSIEVDGEFEVDDDNESFDTSIDDFKKPKLKQHASTNDLNFDILNKFDHLNINTTINSKKNKKKHHIKNVSNSSDKFSKNNKENSEEHSQSLPDLTKPNRDRSPIISNERRSFGDNYSSKSTSSRSNNNSSKTILPILMNNEQKINFLQTHYFKLETQFAMALQNISLRLSQVPKEARLSSLRAELALLNRNLPSEIDIPQLLPPAKKNKYHKILKINIKEAAVLNSAERVPFLLLIEYLSDEMDFDPSSENNKEILRRDHNKYSTVFDTNLISSSSSVSISNHHNNSDQMFNKIENNIKETDLGDLSVVKISNQNIFNKDNLMLQQEVRRSKSFESYKKSVDSRVNNDHTFDDSIDDISKHENYEEDAEGEITSFLQYDDELREYKSPRSSDLNFHSNYTLPNTKDLATQMRIASVMLQQLETNTGGSNEQTIAIKTRIVESMKSLQDQFDKFDYNSLIRKHHDPDDLNTGERKLENDLKLGGLTIKDDNPKHKKQVSNLGEDWNTKKQRIRKHSKFGHLENWDLFSVIAKNGDDLTQEAFACQLIQAISLIWKRNHIGVWVKRMRILVTSATTGLVETITNAVSIHSIKKSLTENSIENGENPKGNILTLKDYFINLYGDEKSLKYKQAQDNFASSLAGYSIICYILQIKDRHNGNIMLDNEGHIIHIDFGFLLSNSPGSVGFEAAPFKLTMEYVELLGGVNGKAFLSFKKLCKDSFKCIRKNSEQLISMVELMQRDSSLPCFKNGDSTSIQLKNRLQLNLSESECDMFIENVLIGKSFNSIYTRLYDQFQLLSQGIYS